MTETTENFVTKPPPVPRVRYIIDPVAFFVALIGAPLVVAAAGFWAAFVPVIAVAFGGPVYLIVGLPVLLFWLSRRPADSGEIAGLALASLAAGLAITALIGLALGSKDVTGVLAFFGGFGVVFAPLWGACFGWLYNLMCRDFYLHPIPNSLH